MKDATAVRHGRVRCGRPQAGETRFEGGNVETHGQRIDVQRDGSFNEFISLGRLGRQTLVVRAVGLNGGVAELRRTVEASY